MHLFLGYYLPSQNTTPLWELENDYYLHNFHTNADRGSVQSMKAYQSMVGVDWSDLGMIVTSWIKTVGSSSSLIVRIEEMKRWGPP